jgi:excisionase family DNA binding protein
VEATITKEWLSYAEAQEYAGIGRTKLWELVSSSCVPAAKVGRSVRISRRGLDEYLQSQSYAESKG